MKKDFISDLKNKEKYNFYDLVDIMTVLRGDNGCPWDREQNHDSIRNNLTEETYEVVEAIDDKNDNLLREELGDLLLQIVFHAKISEEEKKFNIDDVCTEICKKLIIRHPHIFADVIADTSSTVLLNWENIKQKEKGINSLEEYLAAVPKTLPSLHRAEKIQKRINKYKKTKDDESSLIGKIRTSAERYDINSDINSKKHIIGVLLYDLTALAVKNNMNAEEILYKYNNEVIENEKTTDINSQFY